MNLTIAKIKSSSACKLFKMSSVPARRCRSFPRLMRAEGDRVEFTATDLDVSVSCKVEAKVKKPGATTIPVKKLFGIVRELGGTEIEIEVDEKNICTIRCGSSFFKIHGLNADEFPPLPKFKDDKKVLSRRKPSKAC